MTISRERVRDITDGGRLIAQVYDLKACEDVAFLTPPDAEMQCGFGLVPAGRKVAPHIHNRIDRSVQSTSEFIFVLQGEMKVVFYNEVGKAVGEETLTDGMALLQLVGGHGFEITAGTNYLEVKQGPYLGNFKDKTLLSDM